MLGRPQPMSPIEDTPTIFALHFLGGSAREWTPLINRLSGRLSVVPIDLPGFGDASDATGYTVAAMAQWVIVRVREEAPRRWVLAGHSMGAKVACAVARLSQDGRGPEGLSHLIMLAGSPPRPEPMDEAKRRAMLGWFQGSAAESEMEANGYVRDNVGRSLPSGLYQQTVDDVLRACRTAWVAWLDRGSREDWSDRIGVLDTPALIIAGEKDAALGPDAQATMMAPHFAISRLEVMPGARHLLPLECPDLLAERVIDFLGPLHHPEPDVRPDYRALINSDRVSARTRQVLLDRVKPVDTHLDILAEHDMALLRSIVARVIPQNSDGRIDIAARMVDVLASCPGDGWRYADLPADVTALRVGLHTLDTSARSSDQLGFALLPSDRQDSILGDLARGEPRSPDRAPEGQLSPMQMKRWFEDLCSAATQIYVGHPATQGRLGYSGIANRGEGTGPQGFVTVGLGEREPWEPEAHAVAPP